MKNMVEKIKSMEKASKYIKDFVIPELTETGLSVEEISSCLVGTGIAVLCARNAVGQLDSTMKATNSTVQLFLENSRQ